MGVGTFYGAADEIPQQIRNRLPKNIILTAHPKPSKHPLYTAEFLA